jgi:branched-chain amino acid transport system ATP-binding protein
MLTLRNLEVSYGAIRALRGITLEVDAGELVALVGSNGAGKTTTLRTISGLLRPAAGAIRFHGEDISTVPPHRIVGMGISHVPEGRQIFGTLSVRQNLQLGAVAREDRTGLDAASSTSSLSSMNVCARPAAPSPEASSRCWRLAAP